MQANTDGTVFIGSSSIDWMIGVTIFVWDSPVWQSGRRTFSRILLQAEQVGAGTHSFFSSGLGLQIHSGADLAMMSGM
jgi:hypothetical protein